MTDAQGVENANIYTALQRLQYQRQQAEARQANSKQRRTQEATQAREIIEIMVLLGVHGTGQSPGDAMAEWIDNYHEENERQQPGIVEGVRALLESVPAFEDVI